MTPEAVVRAAAEAGLDLIALTDHNTADNCAAAAAAADALGIGFIPGIEVTTSEEIHMICLLPDLGKAAAFSRWLDTLRIPLPPRLRFGKNPSFGERIRRQDERDLLYMARRISLEELPEAVHRYGGLCWPAHADQTSHSVYSVLGCWPEELCCDAVELTGEKEPADLPPQLPRLRASNAHRLWDIRGPGCRLPLDSADFSALRRYLQSPRAI